MKKLLLLALVLSLVLMPGALAALDDNPHTVRGDLQSFIEAFEYAFHGSWESAIDALFWSIPLFALIVIVYGLVYYVAAISIFKEPDHHKYARMIAIGIALIGLVQQKVYNFILGVSTAFVIVMFFIVIIFMLIMSLRHMRTQNAVAGKDYYTNKEQELKAKKKLTELKHDMRMDKAENKHVWNNLRSLEGDLHSMDRLSGSILRQIDQLLQLLRKAYAAKTKGDDSKLHGYVKSLTNGIHSLSATMKDRRRYEHHVQDLLDRIKEEISRWKHEERDELSAERALQREMEKIADGAKRSEARKIINDDAHIRELLNEMHRYLQELGSLNHRMNSLNVKVADTKAKHELHNVQAVQSEISAYNFSEANTKLTNLRHAVVQDEEIIKELEVLDVDVKHVLKNISTVEQSMARYVNDLSHHIHVPTA